MCVTVCGGTFDLRTDQGCNVMWLLCSHRIGKNVIMIDSIHERVLRSVHTYVIKK